MGNAQFFQKATFGLLMYLLQVTISKSYLYLSYKNIQAHLPITEELLSCVDV